MPAFLAVVDENLRIEWLPKPSTIAPFSDHISDSISNNYGSAYYVMCKNDIDQEVIMDQLEVTVAAITGIW